MRGTIFRHRLGGPLDGQVILRSNAGELTRRVLSFELDRETNIQAWDTAFQDLQLRAHPPVGQLIDTQRQIRELCEAILWDRGVDLINVLWDEIVTEWKLDDPSALDHHVRYQGEFTTLGGVLEFAQYPIAQTPNDLLVCVRMDFTEVITGANLVGMVKWLLGIEEQAPVATDDLVAIKYLVEETGVNEKTLRGRIRSARAQGQLAGKMAKQGKTVLIDRVLGLQLASMPDGRGRRHQ